MKQDKIADRGKARAAAIDALVEDLENRYKKAFSKLDRGSQFKGPYAGPNKPLPSGGEIHDTLKADLRHYFGEVFDRLERGEGILGVPGDAPGAWFKVGHPGTHAEVRQANEALFALEDKLGHPPTPEEIREHITLYVLPGEGGSQAINFAQCANCRGILGQFRVLVDGFFGESVSLQ